MIGTYTTIILLLGSTVGQLLQLRLFGIDIALVDISLIAALALSSYWFAKDPKPFLKILKTPAIRTMLWFCGAVAVSWLVAIPQLTFSMSAVLVSGLYAVRLIGYLLMLPVLVRTVNEVGRDHVAKIVVGFGTIMVLAGMVQLALFPDFRIFDHLGWDPHHDRLLGTFLDPNFTAIWLSGFLFFVVLVKTAINKVITRVALASVVFVSIVLTLSRSGLLAFLAGLGALFVVRLKFSYLVLAAALVVGASFVPAVGSRLAGVVDLDTTVRYRLESWEGATAIIKNKPLFGVGYNTLKFRRYEDALPGTSRLVSRFEDGIIRPQQLSSRADAGFDSSLLTIFATTGVIGFAVFSWWLWVLLSLAFAGIKRRGIFSGSGWLMSFTFSLLLSSWFVNAWLYPPILILWMIAISFATLEWSND